MAFDQVMGAPYSVAPFLAFAGRGGSANSPHRHRPEHAARDGVGPAIDQRAGWPSASRWQAGMWSAISAWPGCDASSGTHFVQCHQMRFQPFDRIAEWTRRRFVLSGGGGISSGVIWPPVAIR